MVRWLIINIRMNCWKIGKTIKWNIIICLISELEGQVERDAVLYKSPFSNESGVGSCRRQMLRSDGVLKARAHAFSGPYLQPTCFKLRLSFCLRPFDPGNILRFRFFLRQSKCFIRFPTSINLKDDNRNFFFRCQLYLTYPYTFSKRIL